MKNIDNGLETIGDDDPQQSDDDIEEADQTFCQRLCSVMGNKTYLLVVISVTFLYYIITGIQYWVSDYMILELKQEEATVFICFGVISITGPVLGVVIGGNITAYLGGYSTRKSVQQTLFFTFLCILFAIPIPFVDNFPLFCTLLWFLLFFGGAILPSLTGVLLNTVKNNQKTVANSIAYLAYNLFGYLPSPFIYGAVTDSGEGNNNRAAMLVLMLTAIIPIITFSVACFYIFRDDILGFKEAERKQKLLAGTQVEAKTDAKK